MLKDFWYRNRIGLNIVAALLLIAASGLVMKVFDTPEQKTLSPGELQTAIDNCYEAGDTPTPIYDDKDPTRVFSLECPKPQ